MASITSLGTGSGLDLNGLVDKLVSAERRPVETRLNLKEVDYQTRLSAYGTLKGAMSSFQGSLSKLKSYSTFQSKTATISDTTKLGAGVSSVAVAGSYSIEVSALAKAHSVASDAASAFTDVTDAVGTGTLTFSFGTFSGGVFTANADKVDKTVTIASGDNSLSGIRDAVNSANIGVSASIIYDGSGYRLVFSSKDSGADNSLKITVADADTVHTDTTGLSQLAYDPAAAAGSGKNMTETVTAQDASLTVNGLAITSASNSVTQAIQGVTLNIVDTTTSAVSLTVGNDTKGAETAITNFVGEYNSLIATINDLTKYDPDTKQAGTLLGDATARGIASQIRRELGTALGSSEYSSLASIGITTQSDNTLLLDSSKLKTALGSDVESVGKLFAAVGEPTDSLVKYISSTDKTKAGSYAVEIDQVATQGTFSGNTGITSVTLTSANNIFSLKVDDIQSFNITLTVGTYSTDGDLATLATEMQSKINDDTQLKAAGIAVKVSYDATNDKFVITSDRYGSDSKVVVTANNTTLGLDANGVSTDGLDVAGTIGGVSATGSGQYLLGAGSADGLRIQIQGGSAGLRGGIAFTRGYADRIDSLMSKLLDKDGSIEARLSGVQNSIDDITTQRSDLDVRIAAVEARFRAKFIALDALLSKMQSTSNYLTQQLANLPGSNSGSNN